MELRRGAVVSGVLTGLLLGACAPDTGTSSNVSPPGDGAGSSSSSGGATAPVQLKIIALNDFHGNLEPPTGSNGRITTPDNRQVNAGGATYLASHIAWLRAENPHSIVVSAGDLIGASPLISGLFRDEPTIEAMNLIGLDLNGVGNHEFDQGADELLRMQHGGCHPEKGCTTELPFEGANFQFLAANVFVDRAAGTTLFPPYDVRTYDGLQVAFIGMTLEGTPSIVNPVGIAHLTFADEVETANALVTQLQSQGIEAIVVLLHEGGYTPGSYDACEGISGPVVEIAQGMSDAVDVIVSGHTHQAYNCTIDGKLVTSAASAGRIVTDIDVVIDHVTRDVSSKVAQNVIVTRDVAHEEVDALITRYQDLSAPLANRQVGTITGNILRETNNVGLSAMGAVIADAHLEATEDVAQGGAQIAFTNPGGVRADLLYARGTGESGQGIVTFGELFTVQPFGNNLVSMSLTGAQLKALLEQQFGRDAQGNLVGTVLQVSRGFSYTIRFSAPLGSLVEDMALDGVPIQMTQHYRVTMNSYLASGGDGFSVFTQGTDVLGGVLDVDALEAYFQRHSPVSPPALDRIGTR